MKSNGLFGSLLIFCILFLTFGQCRAQQYSPEFQALLNQVQQAYLTPRGENLSFTRNQYPNIVAALIGHALRQQAFHVQQNPSLENRFRNLQQEARAYITDVARTTSNRSRNEDGSPLTPESLWFVVNKFFQGQEDGWILQNFGVRTGTMPSVLATSREPQPPGPPVGSPPGREKNEINLLGKVAPSVKGPPGGTPPPPPPSRQITLKPDGILGNWSGNLGRTQLRIWKQGDLYLGMMSGKSDGFQYSFKPNEVCLRLKSAGAGPNGPIFKGQYLRSGAADGSLSWGETTFYYHFSSGKEQLGNDANYYNEKSMGCLGTCFKRL